MSIDKRTIYSVSRLNQDVHQSLESSFGVVWVEGEISGFMRPSSGHIYLTLKDSLSQIRVAMFRGRNRFIQFEPENGQKVLVRGKLSLYQTRGDYQLIAEHMELSGRGLLQQQFEERLEKLRELGWFDPERKRALPAYPTCVGVVTSPSGAAIRDVITVLQRRYPPARIVIYPTAVQGQSATNGIVSAIKLANRHARASVLIVTRGGGSREDLWCFNEEPVARAILDSAIPVVCGVGHEIDVTIADLVADVRAPTPSTAAETSVPDQQDVLRHLQLAQHRLLGAWQQQQEQRQQHLQQVLQRLTRNHPKQVLRERQQHNDELTTRLRRAMLAELQRLQMQLLQKKNILQHNSPAQHIERRRLKLSNLNLRLHVAMQSRTTRLKHDLSSKAGTLHAVSPLATLGRGYSIFRDLKQQVITDSKTVDIGDSVEAILATGSLKCRITEINHRDFRNRKKP